MFVKGWNATDTEPNLLGLYLILLTNSLGPTLCLIWHHFETQLEIWGDVLTTSLYQHKS